MSSPVRFYLLHLLIKSVNQHGPGDNWKVIALSVPGRTNKACRKVGQPSVTRRCSLLTDHPATALAALSLSVYQEDGLDCGRGQAAAGTLRTPLMGRSGR